MSGATNEVAALAPFDALLSTDDPLDRLVLRMRALEELAGLINFGDDDKIDKFETDNVRPLYVLAEKTKPTSLRGVWQALDFIRAEMLRDSGEGRLESWSLIERVKYFMLCNLLEYIGEQVCSDKDAAT